ncbi:MAG: DUF2190 family protein [Bacteroidetes bacterium]|nr:DUF2190 family protein [Bacteroidota bacterium]
MANKNPLLIKTLTAAGTVNPYRIVKDGTGMVQAAAATDKLFGVAEGTKSVASGERIDVIVAGIAPVEYGGNVSIGDLLTSDANGKAVAAAPSAGSNNRIIGIAYEAGVSGDIGSVLISQGSVQG